jgi:peptidoglycan/xylan/chitin deacetylase (PgdA/CDA1 family)
MGRILGYAALLIVAAGMCFIAFTLRDARRNEGVLQGKLDRYWDNARKEVYRNVIVLRAQDEVEKRRGGIRHKIIHGDTRTRTLALTFDDGPHPDYTPKLLAILKEHGVPGTFFLVGHMAQKYPDLVKMEFEAGHNIANHTYHHVNLTKIPIEDVAVEIKACGEVLRTITGRSPHLFRPPGGDYNPDVARIVEALGYTLVLWTDDPGDYASPGEDIIESRLLRDISNGGILLLHDGIQETLDLLPGIITEMKKSGYRFVTIDKMIETLPGAPARTSEKEATH